MNPSVSHVTDGCLVTVEGITEKIVRDLGGNRTHDREAPRILWPLTRKNSQWATWFYWGLIHEVHCGLDKVIFIQRGVYERWIERGSPECAPVQNSSFKEEPWLIIDKFFEFECS